MGKGSSRDARQKTHSGGSRLKSLRRESAELDEELERARKRRDRAQARLEALEAIAEQLSTAIAAAESDDAARDARREAADATAEAAGLPLDSSNGTAPSGSAATAVTTARKRRVKPAEPTLDDGPEAIDLG